MWKNILKRIIIVSIIILLLSTLCLPVLASEGKPDLIIGDAKSNSTDEEMKRPEFYSGFVWGHYTKIEKSYPGIEVWCNMGEIEFCSFHDIQWLHISLFFGFARFGVIYGLALHTLVG